MKHEFFGRLPDGRTVRAYELRGSPGFSARVLIYGGIIQSLLVPWRDGLLADIVLGGADLGFYLRRHPYFGCIVGRVAGRISRGTFRIRNKDYRLAINNPPQTICMAVRTDSTVACGRRSRAGRTRLCCVTAV